MIIATRIINDKPLNALCPILRSSCGYHKSVGQDSANEVCRVAVSDARLGPKRSKRTGIVNLSRTSINRLEQLIDLFVRHFLSEVCENCAY